MIEHCDESNAHSFCNFLGCCLKHPSFRLCFPFPAHNAVHLSFHQLQKMDNKSAQCLQCKSHAWLKATPEEERLSTPSEDNKYRMDSQVSLVQCDMDDCVQYRDVDLLLKAGGAW